MPTTITLVSVEDVPELSSKSLAELEALQQQHKAYRLEARAACQRIQAITDTKRAKVEAMRKLEGMSQAERDALAQMLAPNGIASNGGVGTPGH